MPSRATLNKSEILRLKNDIDALFKEGKYVKVLPLKILYQATTPDQADSESKNLHDPIQVLFVVSKRTLKSAARRNRVKRCMREAYRHLKCEMRLMLSQKCPSVRQLRLAFLFQSAPSESVSTKQMKTVLNKGIEMLIVRLSREQTAAKTSPRESRAE
jgi:ribonuclease P protein component